MKIAIYCRLKNRKFYNARIENQLNAYREYAAQHGYTVVAEFCDAVGDYELNFPRPTCLLITIWQAN